MTTTKEEQSSFKDILTNAVSEVQKLQDEADITKKN
jgi:flagellar hook-basal body complex protein FliE